MDFQVGATEGEVRRLGRRIVVVMRAAVLLCASGAALAQALPEQRAATAAAVVGLVAWNAVHLRFDLGRLLLPVDTLVVMGLCLTQSWTVPPDALGASTNWVLAVVSATAVAHQWLTGPATAALSTTVIIAAHLAGSLLTVGGDATGAVRLGLWAFSEAALSGVLFRLVRAAARRADRAVESGERARRDAAVAAARREDEREHLALLHDTAASTLLAVGARMVGDQAPWLAEQAARDLAALAAQPGLPVGRTDLVRLLDEVARQAPVAVALRSPPTLPVRAEHAAAVGAAVREALTNVARHAEVDTAELVVDHVGRAVVVEVSDGGRGFAPDRVPPHRRGLSRSVRERMAAVGGRADVTSRPGAGTRVRLELADG
ncbi:sensor histidine kinase [Saccharothrix obliqua]|uniref:sensor histidine kinase n=1 Tax=Saccharothrix obliqua TaxID=2861747 RepID=UPI001C5CE9C0|nr:ATP-binding protein [Saccharothrix obliqua]MBW4721343.1 ATP-binding protein [Saccharothrix obliqua]